MAESAPGDDRRMGQRRDAQRNRAALVAAAARELKRSSRLDMHRLAAAAGVSRSTLYRHFGGPDAVRRAVLEQALSEVRAMLAVEVREDRPLLAVLRGVVAGLVEIGAHYPFDETDDLILAGELEEIADELAPLVDSVRQAADVGPGPPGDWLRAASAHFVESCLKAASEGTAPPVAEEGLVAALTDPLDQGLAILDGDGRLLAANPAARQALGLEGGDQPPVGTQLTRPRGDILYEDGSPCPSEAYPLAVAVRRGETQTGSVRGHRDATGTVRWFSVRAFPLRRAPGEEPYGVVGVLSDVSEQKRAELAKLPPPGTLGREQPVALDVARVLDEVPPHLLPEQLVAEARRLTKVPVALYVLDIDGSHLLRLAGPEDFPARIQAPLALGPELAPDGIPDLSTRLESQLPGVVMAPMWLRGRAVGVLLALRGSEAVLADVARQGAAAMELATTYTDVFDATRRRKDMNPAGEIQQSLLPPRIVRLGSGEIGGSVLPSYEVGGDWFDYVENRDGAWIAIADASGRGPTAGGLGSVGLAALRAARRNDASLEEAAQTIHETIHDMGRPDFFLTAVLARWSSAYSLFSWINAGHPPPLLLRRDGRVEELLGDRAFPLGIFERERRFRRSHRRLEAGERVVLYTDGISRRPTADGYFGRDGIARAALDAGGGSATAIARTIQEAVMSATTDELRDDAAVVVLAPVPAEEQPLSE